MPSFNSKKKMDLQVDLPEEILTDIFSRLPPKSVGKFRCLSKFWLKFLSTQQFIKSHLARRPKQESIILLSPSLAACTIETIRDDDETISRELAITPGIGGTRFEGSCNGLVLLVNSGGDEDDFEAFEADDEGEVFLVNPITLEWVKIPNSPFASCENDGVHTIYGFGYDSVIDDYKVVAVSYHSTDVSDLFVVDFGVYYMKTGVWKRIETPPHQYTCYDDSLSGAYVNGAYHWMGLWREGLARQVIDAFDLATEVFYEIPFPGGVSMEHSMIGTVGVIGGYLCVVDAVSSSVGIDVWIMEEYGVANSWRKLITVEGYHSGDLCVPLCFLEERDEVVCMVEEQRFVVYDVTDGTSRDLVVDGLPEEDFEHGGTFVGSLVSPVAIRGAPIM